MAQGVVVVGGGLLSPRAVAAVRAGAVVVAADSGLDHAVEAGLTPAVLVGDLDSISAGGHMWAYAQGVTIDQHPCDKDATDTELALTTVARRDDIDDVLLVGGVGDRLDHLLGTLLALGAPALDHLASVRAIIGDTEFVVVRPERPATLDAEPGRTFSVLALHGAADGVTVTGGRWPLVDELLPANVSRGVSNIAEGTLMISCTSGTVTVVVP